MQRPESSRTYRDRLIETQLVFVFIFVVFVVFVEFVFVLIELFFVFVEFFLVLQLLFVILEQFELLVLAFFEFFELVELAQLLLVLRRGRYEWNCRNDRLIVGSFTRPAACSSRQGGRYQEPATQ